MILRQYCYFWTVQIKRIALHTVYILILRLFIPQDLCIYWITFAHIYWISKWNSIQPQVRLLWRCVCLVSCVDHQWSDKLRVSYPQGEGRRPGLVNDHLLRVVCSRPGLHRGVGGEAVATEHGERRLSGQVDAGIRAVVPPRTGGLWQVLRGTPRLTPPRDGVAGAGWLGRDLGPHQGWKRVFVRGRHRVHGAITRAASHGVRWRSALIVTRRSLLRAVGAWAGSLERSLWGEKKTGLCVRLLMSLRLPSFPYPAVGVNLLGPLTLPSMEYAGLPSLPKRVILASM